MRCCLDKRVLGGLAAIALVVVALAPHLFITVLPFLLVAVCPLSMLLMGKTLWGGGGNRQPAAVVQESPSPSRAPVAPDRQPG